MYLRRIALRNWKIFESAEMSFPQPRPGRGVVLIGGKNGYGKTSLLEAVTLGLYGHRALHEIDRALRVGAAGDATGSRRLSYTRFLERAFHRGALDRGETVAEVVLEFGTGEGPMIIERRWHFTGRGELLVEDEELLVRLGEDEHILPVPLGEDALDHYQDEIARRLLPASLVPFFLFDGEQVKRLAERDMADQIRIGVEGVLGVHLLRELEADVRDFAKDRRRGAFAVGDAHYERLRHETETLEAEERDVRLRLEEVEGDLAPAKGARDRLVARLGAISGGTYADLRSILERKEQIERELDRLRLELNGFLAKDLPFILVGVPLRGALRSQLQAEEVLEGWNLRRRAEHEDLERFLSAFEAADPDFKPPLAQEHEDQLGERIRNAWAALGHPPPIGCADAFRHHYMMGKRRGDVDYRLRQIDQLGLERFTDLYESIKSREAERKRLTRQMAEREGVDADEHDLRDELSRLTAQIDEAEERRRTLDRELAGVRAQLAPKNAELARVEADRRAGQPILARVDLANRLAAALELIVSRAYPLYLERIADAMTEAYRAISHKRLVERVVLGADCSVELLDGQGRNIREFDASAGESQIFAMALIGAIAAVAGRPFPIVIDTPLGRLDPDHRARMLDFFTRGDAQVILLSQPGEVNGRYLEQIKDRVSIAYRLDHLGDEGGLGQSVPREGYFTVLEA